MTHIPDFQPRLHHFGLSVANLDETVAWYKDKLGFEDDSHYALDFPQLQARVAFLRRGDFGLELFEVSGSSGMPGHARQTGTDLHVQGLKHVALAVEDIDRARAALTARGVTFVMDTAPVPGPRGARFAFFRDNNGLLIELYQAHGP